MLATPPPQLPQHCPIPAYVAQYQIEAYGFNVGTNTRTLEKHGDKYKLTVDAKSSLLFYKDEIIQTSSGTVTPKWLVPVHYTSWRMHKDQRSDIKYDWAKSIAHAMKNGETKMVPIKPGTQDFTSGQLTVRKLLLDNTKPIEFDLVKSNKLQTYHFTVIGHPVIKTKIGIVKTIELERLDGPRVTHFWLAPEYGYLLVKSNQRRDGKMQAELFIKNYRPGKECVFS